MAHQVSVGHGFFEEQSILRLHGKGTQQNGPEEYNLFHMINESEPVAPQTNSIPQKAKRPKV